MKKILALAVCILIMVSLFAGCGSSKKTLYVYNVGDYIDESVIELFEEEYPDIDVKYETYYTNEDMYSKVKAGRTAYDVVFPSDYMVERMIEEDMLLPIDFKNVPNYKNIGDEFKGLDYDPEAKYSVPYMWGTMGILYNKKMVDAKDVESWHAMYDDKYEGEIFMLDSVRDMVSITLKSLGYSMNSDNDKHLKAAERALMKQKPLVKAYCGDEVKDKMIANEGAMTIAWSGDAFYCMDLNKDLAYSVPKEGSNLWFDSMVIPKTSKNKKEAELFIDFMCRPEIAKMNAEYIGYSTANVAGRDLLADEIKNDPLRYPDITKLENMEIFTYDSELARKQMDLWNRVKSK